MRGADRAIWRPAGGHFRTGLARRTLVLLAGATLALGASSYARIWHMHQTEWVFASEGDIEPSVVVHRPEDLGGSRRAFRPPKLTTEGLTGAFSFGSRSFDVGFGSWGGTWDYRSSGGVTPIYWNRTSFSDEMIAPTNLPIRAHYCQREWLPPTRGDLVFVAFFFTPAGILAACINLLVLPLVLRRLSPDGAWCGPACRQGFHRITRWTCVALIVVGLVWLIGAMNPGNWLIDRNGLSRLVARVLLAVMVVTPAVAVVYGIRRDVGAVLFPRRALTVTIAVLCHVIALVGWHAAVLAVTVNLPRSESNSPDDSRSPPRETVKLTGKPAPGFTLPSMDGRAVSLAEFKGKKPVLLVFWATWCTPCIREIPTLVKLHQEFADKGLAVIAVSTDRDLSTVEAFVKREGTPYLILHDPKGEAAQQYLVDDLPRTLLIDKSGTVVQTWRGWDGEEEEKQIREELAKLLGE